MSTQSLSPAAASSAAKPPGKRRIALASFVAHDHLPGLLALLRSLALTNPRICLDFVVLHEDLEPAAVEAVGELHPHVVPHRVDAADPNGGAPARQAARVLDLFENLDYDTVIALDADLVVLGDIGDLLSQRQGLSAVEGGGVLVANRDDLGLLEAVRDGGDPEVAKDAPAPRFGGPDERVRRGFDLSTEDFHTAFFALPGAKHPDLVTHYGRRLAEGGGIDRSTALTLASALRAVSEYQEAVRVLYLGLDVDGAVEPRFQLALGEALMAVSRYDEAEAHLLLATRLPETAARAFGLLAECAWITGEFEHAANSARSGLDADPTDQKCRLLYGRSTASADLAAADSAAPDSGDQLAHVAFYMDERGNAGDKVLPESVRLCLDADTGSRRWHSTHAHRLFDESALESVNARRGLVIGGGGLFLPDTSPNGNSGWQWNVPDDALKRITVPIAVFAVGYNVFEGQRYAQERFTENLRLLVSSSAFFGLRNHGSIERVRAMLPADLADRVVFQPCPTTVARQLVAGWQDLPERAETILLNCAYDRSDKRFGHDYGHFLDQMAQAVTALGERAEVRYAAHTPGDERFVFDLRREHGISLPVEPLYDLSTAEIWAVYKATRLVIGMRGHAAMIPFGCGTPIVSLISHPKLAYFLDDIERPDWGVSIHDPRLGAILVERSAAMLDDHEAMLADVAERQQRLWEITQDNLAGLRTVLGGTG